MGWKQFLRKSVTGGTPLIELRQNLAEIISSGVDRDDLVRELSVIRDEFSKSGDDDAEDTVLEMMDFFAGWCSPKMRL